MDEKHWAEPDSPWEDERVSGSLLEPRTAQDGTPLPGMRAYRGNKEIYNKAQELLNSTNDLADKIGVDPDEVKPEAVEKERPEGFYGEMETTDTDLLVKAGEAFEKVKAPLKSVYGLTEDYWQALVNNAAAMARLGETINQANLKKACPHIPVEIIDKTMGTRAFQRILEYRGVLQDDSPVGMTERQLMTINLLTNFTDTRKVSDKLKSIGVTDSEFQQWLSSNRRFKTIYRRLSEQIFDEAQGAVNVALASGAVDGDIRFIKYFNEMSGRFDPAAKQNMDVQQVLSAITEIITSVVKDPDLLREIGGRMAMLVGGNSGMSGALNSTVSHQPQQLDGPGNGQSQSPQPSQSSQSSQSSFFF